MRPNKHGRALRVAAAVTVIGGIATVAGGLYLRSLLSAESLGKKILGFMANAIAIRSNNPGSPGEALRVGILDQVLEPSDPFFKLIWIGLRDGMAEIAARIS